MFASPIVPALHVRPGGIEVATRGGRTLTVTEVTFPDDARRETRTALDALVHHVSRTAREEIDALRAALDGRLAALEGALAGPNPSEPLERLMQDLSRAAGDEAEAAATCARRE